MISKDANSAKAWFRKDSQVSASVLALKIMYMETTLVGLVSSIATLTTTLFSKQFSLNSLSCLPFINFETVGGKQVPRTVLTIGIFSYD